MKTNVSYPKEMRDKAKAEKLHLVTVQALGATVQAPVSKSEAQGVFNCALGLIKRELPPVLRAQVLEFEPRLTHSVWKDHLGISVDEDTGEETSLTDDELIEHLKQGVKDGKWVGWRLMHVVKEVKGNCD